MTYFALWKSEKRDRTINYDCSVCIANKWYETRACFLENGLGEEEYSFTLPLFDDSVHPPKQVGKENITLDVEGVLEKIDSLAFVFTDMPPFDVAQRYFRIPELCLAGLVDGFTADLIALEAACKAYNCLPYGGGIQEQPTVILEAFEIIREAQSDYYRIKFAKDESERANRQPPNTGGLKKVRTK